jgi:hypothetical protein
MLAARHLTEEEVEQYSMGAIPDGECGEIEDHLLICETCQGRVSEHDVYFGAMRAGCAGLIDDPAGWFERLFRFPGFPRLAPVAAALAVLLVAGVMRSRLAAPVGSGPAVVVSLEAMRGASSGVQAPAGRPLALHLDLGGLTRTASRAEAVDGEGRVVWKGPVAASSGSPDVVVDLPRLKAGQYFVRIYSEGGDLLREYGLEAGQESGR